jgi:hypothetical protein
MIELGLLRIPLEVHHKRAYDRWRRCLAVELCKEVGARKNGAAGQPLAKHLKLRARHDPPCPDTIGRDGPSP